MLVAMAAMTFTACEDVPEPYGKPQNSGNGNSGEAGSLPYSSVNMSTGWSLVSVTEGQPWTTGKSYVQATGYQKWDGADQKSNRAVEGWLVSPTINTTGADSVKISFDYTIKYTNNVSGWEDYHKIYVSNDYDGKNFENATWIPVPFTPISSPYSDWTLYSSGEIQLPQELANQESVYVAFWFKAPENASTTWELQNFKIESGQANSGDNPNPGGDEVVLPYESDNLNTGWALVGVTVDQPWSQGSSYVQATGYQKWGGANDKSNRAVEGWLVSPAINTTDADSVKISFDYTLKYTNNVSGWEAYHKIYASNNYDGTNFENATWIPVPFTPEASKFTDWTLYPSGEIQLPQELAGKENVHVAFWFKAPENASTTWELKNFKMEAGVANSGENTNPSGEVQKVTIAQFNAAAVSNDVWYELKGKVTNLKAGDKYGNFDLVDETGSVYVYGLLSEKGGEKQKFQELVAAKGITEGSVITIIGNRGYYAANDKIEVVNAYFVSIEPDSNNQGGGDDGQPVTAEGSYSKPYSVSAVIAKGTTASTNNVYVKAYIVGYVDGKSIAEGARFSNEDVTSNTNLLIADASNETDVSKCVPVQLPNNPVRTGLNLKDNPSFLGKQVLLYGNLEKYFSVAGVKSVTYAECDGKFFGTKP